MNTKVLFFFNNLRVHASCTVQATALTSCTNVANEILGRVEGQQDGKWVDPHNGGTYSVLSSNNNVLELKRVTGNKKYTDKMKLTLTDNGTVSCKITGCSESQVTSIADFSTNYCNLHNLYCGSADGCKPVETDFVSNESKVKPSPGAGSDTSACIAN